MLKQISKNYTINISPSLPRGIYRLEPVKTIEIGDIVYFNIPSEVENLLREREYTYIFVKTFIKKVAAKEGDTISIINKNLYVNEENWGIVFDADPQNRKIPQLTIEELTPQEGEILPLTEVEYSFDGRYFGPIKISEIKYKCKLVFEF